MDQKENELLHNESLKLTTNKNEIYNKWAESYDNYVKSKKYTGPNELVSELCNIIYYRELENKKITILDFGCGTGLVGEEIRKRMMIVCLDGIDISEKMIIKCAKKKCYNKIFNIDLSKDNLKKEYINQYNFIVSSGVFLEGHVPFSIIPNLIKYLKPYGYLLITIRESYSKDNNNNNNYKDFKLYITNNSNLLLKKILRINYLENVKCELYILQKL